MAKKLKLSHGVYPLLLITWQDALVDNGWVPTTTPMSAASIRSIGWKIMENDKCIVLGSDIGDDIDATTKVTTTETNRRIAIPKDWVLSIKDLS